MSLIDLSGRRAVVTGGSRGIGRAAALALAKAGADVGIGYHVNEDAAQRTVAELRGLGVRTFAESGGLGDPGAAHALFERCEREFGGVDAVVANAGIWNADHVPISEMTDTEWSTTMSANLNSVFHTVREAARRISGGGKIVIVSSTAGQRGEAGHADYAATKGALISLVKSLAVELAAKDVNVNAVAPGWVETDMTENVLATGVRDRVLAEIPLRRIASAEDLAGPIAFLCSDLARHVTGEVLNVNGGSVLCG